MDIKTRIKTAIIAAIVPLFLSCGSKTAKHDAAGMFEATEIIVSADVSGRLVAFDLQKGAQIEEGQLLGSIDSTQLRLKKMQLLAAQKAARVQIDTLTAATGSMSSEDDAFSKQMEQVNAQLRKCRIVSPVAGRVLDKFVDEKEFITAGKPLYSVADTRVMYLRAYVQEQQLENIATGQQATVYVAHTGGETKIYTGRVTWISNKAEFTPESTQSSGERHTPLYATKIEVANTDGYLRVGVYGDVDYNR